MAANTFHNKHSTPLENFDAKVYSEFPVDGSKECMALVEITCPSSTNAPLAVNLILLADVSWSMHKSIPSLKCTLKAIGKFLSEFQERNITLTLITFNSSSEVIFSGIISEESEENYFTLVESISAKGSTNISEALDLSKQYIVENMLNNVVLLSDGSPTSGFRTISEFETYRKSFDDNVDIITIGYGKSYDPNLLESIGRFTYAASESDIPSIIGSYLGQVLSTYAFGARIVLENSSNFSRVVLGSKDIGPLFFDRVYKFGVSVPEDKVDEFVGTNIQFEYFIYEYETSENGETNTKIKKIIINTNFYDSREEELPTNIYSLYYDSSASRLIKTINSRKEEQTFTDTFSNCILRRIERWNQDIGKEAIIRVKDAIESKSDLHRNCFDSSTTSTQIGYGENTSFQTPTQQNCRSGTLGRYTQL